MESICRLCNTPSQLCRSHILPEFLYHPLYDEKHRFTILTAGVEGARYGQRGSTERLLCRACERHMCRYEKYAAEVMTGRLGHRYQQHGGRIIIRGIEYSHFKLFQISILWRASISTLEFFRLVSLGPREERLRQMLLASDPGNPEEFGCVVVFSHDGGQDISDTLLNPEPIRWAGRRMYKFFFAGAAWLYHCDRQPPSPHLQKFFLRPEGTLLGLTGDLHDAQILAPSVKRLANELGCD